MLHQGTTDSMIAHLRAHPEVDPASCADAVADVVLGGTTTTARAADGA